MIKEEDSREDATTRRKDVEEIARIAVDRGLHMHKELGPGLLEIIYEAVLADALEREGLLVERQKAIEFTFSRLRVNR